MAIPGGCIAALALLWSCAVTAATATVVPSNAEPQEGDTFYVTVKGAGFPETTGATLGLTWNSDVVSVTGTELAPGSPFTDLLADPPYVMLTILAPISGTQPSGDFDAFRITFKALAKGDAKITLVDDGSDYAWTGADGSPLDVTYAQADVKIATPLPGAAWLMMPAFAMLGPWVRRKARA